MHRRQRQIPFARQVPAAAGQDRGPEPRRGSRLPDGQEAAPFQPAGPPLDGALAPAGDGHEPRQRRPGAHRAGLGGPCDRRHDEAQSGRAVLAQRGAVRVRFHRAQPFPALRAHPCRARWHGREGVRGLPGAALRRVGTRACWARRRTACYRRLRIGEAGTGRLRLWCVGPVAKPAKATATGSTWDSDVDALSARTGAGALFFCGWWPPGGGQTSRPWSRNGPPAPRWRAGPGVSGFAPPVMPG